MELLELPPNQIDVYPGSLEETLTEDATNFPYKIINIVCLAKMVRPDPESKINFEELEKRITVKRLNRFPCVLFKIDNISVILFKNGKLILTGIKKRETIEPLRLKIIDHLRDKGKLEFSAMTTEIQNLVVMSQLGKIINLEMACLTLTNCLYEPEQFPAAIIKPTTGGTFLIFSNSKIIGLGMKSMDMVKNSLKNLISDIFENDLFIRINDDDPFDDDQLFF